MLKKMKITDSELCPHCGAVDDIAHFFHQCINVRSLWNELQLLIYLQFGVRIALDENTVLLGLKRDDYRNIKREKINRINHFILVGKMSIGMFRYGKGYDLLTTFENECKLRKIV